MGGQIVFGKASFRFVVLYLGGRPPPPITRVHVFDFPFERDDRSLEVAFEAYGAVTSVKKQTFLSNQNISNSTRLVDVALSGVLPRFLMVNGYLCRRLWYRGQPLVAIFVPFRATDRQTALTRTSAESVGKPGTLLGIVPMMGQRETEDFPPLASSSQSAEASVSRYSSDSQLLKDNELDLRQSQSILQDLVPVSGDSSEAESNQRASTRVGKDKGLSTKRSNSAPSPSFNICFTNSQEFSSLDTNSAELDGNNESTAVRNISNERLNVINDNTSANSTKKSDEIINNSSENSTERVNEVINNSSNERSNEVKDITVNESD